MIKIYILTIIFGFVFYYNVPLNGHVAAEHEQKALTVELHGDLLTVDARNTTLEQVLYAIGEKARLEVIINGKLSPKPSSWSIVNKPLIDSIRSLAGSHNVAMRYGDRLTGKVAKLWIFGNQDEIQYLSEMVKQDNYPLITRLKAVNDLKKIGSKQASKVLSKCLGDRDPSLRIEAIKSINDIGADHAIPIIGRVLFSDPDPEVRMSALQLIAEQDSEASRAFLKVALEDKDKNVRQAAEMLSSR